MPLYQYECPKCGGRFDQITPMHMASVGVVCELCGKADAHRVFGAAQIRTEATFQSGIKLGGAQFGDATREFYLNAAREAGVNPEGKVYDSRIAAFPGDPQAWVKNADEVRRVIEERNWSCTGDMTVKCEPVPPAPNVPLADHIVEELVEDRLVEQLGEDFTEASGAIVERAREDVLNTHVRPA
jgi:putative FmdB family regulatory protein